MCGVAADKKVKRLIRVIMIGVLRSPEINLFLCVHKTDHVDCLCAGFASVVMFASHEELHSSSICQPTHDSISVVANCNAH